MFNINKGLVKINNEPKLLTFYITLFQKHLPTYNNLKHTQILFNIMINKE